LSAFCAMTPSLPMA